MRDETPATGAGSLPSADRPKGDHRIVLPSEPMAVRRALDCIKRALEPMRLGVEEVGTMELVVAEALNNVVEHAYQERPNGLVEIEMTEGTAGVHFCIIDYGQPMPDGELPLGRAPDPDVDMPDMPEGGFGWFLIRDLAHELEYARRADRNELTFRLALRGEKSA